MIELPVVPAVKNEEHLKRPDWLRVKLPYGDNYRNVRGIVTEQKLHTVCESARCPNMGECWGEGTATFMILGNTCTRGCSFCAVATGRPNEYDEQEPERVAEAIRQMGVKHAVLTSVNRDELKDGGAAIWAATVRESYKLSPGLTMETLIPDFRSKWEALEVVLVEKPDVVSHNMETVQRLYRRVRPQAKYDRSLEQIKRTKEAGLRTKSGIMVGLGETPEEVYEIMDDLVAYGCDVMTLGQYLQPTKMHLPVEEFITPEMFDHYKEVGLSKGLDYVESGPLVRSSYHSERHLGTGENCPLMADITSRKDIETLVDRFYERVFADEVLAPMFADVDWPHHKPRMYSFWESILLGAMSYSGNPMQAHILLNQRMPLKPEHFEHWLALFEQTLADNFSGPKADEALTRAQGIAALIAHKVGE